MLVIISFYQNHDMSSIIAEARIVLDESEGHTKMRCWTTYLRVMETVKMTASAETALAAPYVRRNVIATHD